VFAFGNGCSRDKGRDVPAPPSSTSQGASETPEKIAASAAEDWLSLVDAGNYEQSWTEADTGFRRAIDQPGWKKALDAVRAPLCKVISRKLKTVNYASALPGAPDGEYVILQFDTSFEHKRTAVENVTPTKEADGHWRVSGYFIK
jgi:hypothetical protein